MSKRRSASVSRYFERFIRNWRDSSESERGFSIDLEKVPAEPDKGAPEAKVEFISRSVAEDWSALDRLVMTDTVLTPLQKERYFLLSAEQNPDKRERLLSMENLYPYPVSYTHLDVYKRQRLLSMENLYPYLTYEVYPRLRTVRFESVSYTHLDVYKRQLIYDP